MRSVWRLWPLWLATNSPSACMRSNRQWEIQKKRAHTKHLKRKTDYTGLSKYVLPKSQWETFFLNTTKNGLPVISWSSMFRKIYFNFSKKKNGWSSFVLGTCPMATTINHSVSTNYISNADCWLTPNDNSKDFDICDSKLHQQKDEQAKTKLILCSCSFALKSIEWLVLLFRCHCN